MKKNTPVVHCVFTEAETDLREILAESFRLYLRRILAHERENTQFSR